MVRSAVSTDTAPESFVRTVGGDVPAHLLGRVNYHEHLFQRTPLLPGEDLDDEERTGREIASMRDAGIDAVVDATPWGLGRRPAAVARIAGESGVRVVATAGFHREAHYPDRGDVLALSAERLAEICLGELTGGQPDRDRLDGGEPATDPDGAPVRAGLLKAGVGYWSITAFEGRVLEGVAAAQRATGAPVMVHLEYGTCAHEVLDHLEANGVPADRVVLAHIDRSPDPILYGELAARGAYLGCDGAARLKDWPESILIDAIGAAWEAGHGGRILLGGDVARRSRYRAYGGAPGIAYLTERFTPRLAMRIGADAVRALLTDNPQRLLTWAAPDARPLRNDTQE